MNKLMGFYELKSLNIPTVPWKLFSTDTVLDPDLLWTVRVATTAGSDLNLPRAVGVGADEAYLKGKAFLKEFAYKGIVIYYPYFIAEKSGVLDLNSQRTVIEAVERDLWNLVTYGRKNVTVIAQTAQPQSAGVQSAAGDLQFSGDEAFLLPDEIKELIRYGALIRGRYRDEINVGGSILAEWSYAYNTDRSHMPVGDRYLVFYELRGLPVL